jgi:hypothetical protein
MKPIPQNQWLQHGAFMHKDPFPKARRGRHTKNALVTSIFLRRVHLDHSNVGIVHAWVPRAPFGSRMPHKQHSAKHHIRPHSKHNGALLLLLLITEPRCSRHAAVRFLTIIGFLQRHVAPTKQQIRHLERACVGVYTMKRQADVCPARRNSLN